jgi:hypothetical protein
MDPETLGTVADRYPWASWAIWDESFPDGDCVERQPAQLVEFVREHRELLTPDIVFAGLNRSDDLAAPFSNFHAPSRTHYDYRLKSFVQDGGLTRLRGAYMTDLVDEVDPDSHNVVVTDADADVFLEQLKLLGQSEYHVLCFGNAPFDGLVDYFDATVTRSVPELKHATVEARDTTIQLYRLWFYGLYGANQEKVEVVERQLQTLNERLA